MPNTVNYHAIIFNVEEHAIIAAAQAVIGIEIR